MKALIGLRRIQMSPRYLSPIYGTMRRQIEEAMPRMTTRVILVFVQGRWTVSSWLPHFEHLIIITQNMGFGKTIFSSEP